jgi:hypothetical protein
MVPPWVVRCYRLRYPSPPAASPIRVATSGSGRSACRLAGLGGYKHFTAAAFRAAPCQGTRLSRRKRPDVASPGVGSGEKAIPLARAAGRETLPLGRVVRVSGHPAGRLEQWIGADNGHYRRPFSGPRGVNLSFHGENSWDQFPSSASSGHSPELQLFRNRTSGESVAIVRTQLIMTEASAMIGWHGLRSLARSASHVG